MDDAEHGCNGSSVVRGAVLRSLHAVALGASARPDPRFVIERHEPAYLQTWRSGLLNGKVAAALQELEECRVCPRNCRINRLKDERRVCNTGRHPVVSSAFPHFGEEDCLRVHNGSGTIFFASLRLLEGLIDIYMPDFKFWHRESARVLCKAKDYPAVARAAIKEMHRQVGDLRFGPDGTARRGLLVRHLVMPGQTDEAEAIMRWLSDDVSRYTYVNVMGNINPNIKSAKSPATESHATSRSTGARPTAR